MKWTSVQKEGLSQTVIASILRRELNARLNRIESVLKKQIIMLTHLEKERESPPMQRFILGNKYMQIPFNKMDRICLFNLITRF